MTSLGRRSAQCLGALLGALIVSCGPQPVAVLTGLEVVVAEGDGQFGTVGQVLSNPLRAVVRSEATHAPQEGIGVRWEVEQGGATLATSATVTTDETGSVEARVQLGAVPSRVTVRATIVQQPSASVAFLLHTVEPPVLAGLVPTAAAAGDTVTLFGSNFSPVAEQNVVLFSGVRGRVVEASASELSVVVPECLPARLVSVGVQLGVIRSAPVGLNVTEAGVVTSIPVGEVLDVADDQGFECFALEGGDGIQYLAIAYSASTVGAAMHPYQLTALSSASGVSPAGAEPARHPRVPATPREVQDDAAAGRAQARWDERLRAAEGELIARLRSTVSVGPSAAPTGPTAVPTVGETRTFHVWSGPSSFDQVTAVARYVGEEAAVFVDQDAPAGGFTVTELEALTARFDDVIHPVVTSAFGSTSDLDGNDRVIILFTPVVNGLTSPGASGFVGGFFFGNDLLPGEANSNGGEIFYALVPDPTGIHSDPRDKESVLNVVPAVLAHEFQHMVQFNERFLRLDGGQEALWLSEALAQMAEELVARHYDDAGDPDSAEMFRAGARSRVVRYLTDTRDVSLIVSTGQGSLAERGAGFLHLLYLTDQSSVELLGELSRSTRTGVANVEAKVGRDWPDILADWWAATYLDGPGPETGLLTYPELDLRAYLGPPFPLDPEPIGPSSMTDTGALLSSSAAYYLLTPNPAGTATVRLGGEAGGTSSPQAALRLRIIRIS